MVSASAKFIVSVLTYLTVFFSALTLSSCGSFSTRPEDRSGAPGNHEIPPSAVDSHRYKEEQFAARVAALAEEEAHLARQRTQWLKAVERRESAARNAIAQANLKAAGSVSEAEARRAKAIQHAKEIESAAAAREAALLATLRAQRSSVDALLKSAEPGLVMETFPEEALAQISSEFQLANITRATEPDYVVRLSADKRIPKPGTGEMRIWIGHEEHTPTTPSDMVSDSASLPSTVIGESAKVEPRAPGFQIDPQGAECLQIHPEGSHLLYTLRPQEEGTHEITAQIRLYDTPDCTGAQRPKAAPTLTVTVYVDAGRIVKRGSGELMAIVWDKFKDFWGIFVATIFGLLLFFFRKSLKR